jgi:hypothetical protein
VPIIPPTRPRSLSFWQLRVRWDRPTTRASGTSSSPSCLLK